jgi:putative endonuclease
VAGSALKHRSAPGGREAGALWERSAESFLRRRGLNLLHRNFRCRFGEIDLVMEDGATIVFVEVKYRSSSRHGSGANAVTARKQGRISRTAAWYLAKNPHRAEQDCRFDVVSMDPGKEDNGIQWIRNAFYANTG